MITGRKYHSQCKASVVTMTAQSYFEPIMFIICIAHVGTTISITYCISMYVCTLYS